MTVKETADFKHQISLLEPGEIGNSVRLVVRTSFGVACPSYKCTGIICADTIHDVADPDTFSRFDRFCLRQTLDDLKTDGALKLCDQCQNGYIQDNCLCSDLDCRERTLRVRTKEEIRRHKRWAIENAKSHHLLGVWMSKSNVKCCPSCYKPIEKNMGCDHMYCIQCKKNFNWSQAPAFGTGAHWWRPDPKKSKPQEDPPAPAAAPVVAL
jgi:ariadne-1